MLIKTLVRSRTKKEIAVIKGIYLSKLFIFTAQQENELTQNLNFFEPVNLLKSKSCFNYYSQSYYRKNNYHTYERVRLPV